MGKDAEIWWFKDKAGAAAELKKLKTSDTTPGIAKPWSRNFWGGGRND